MEQFSDDIIKMTFPIPIKCSLKTIKSLWESKRLMGKAYLTAAEVERYVLHI